MASLNGLAIEIWQICEDHGFHEPIDPQMGERGMRLALIHSELSEALEDLRKDRIREHVEEMIDVLIRTLHYLSVEGVDVDTALRAKMEKNAARPYKHGKKF
jgi:NTP pyrophosphatase (non-canonical NTP hydrolase)